MRRAHTDGVGRLGPWLLVLLAWPAPARGERGSFRLQLDAGLDGRYANTSSNVRVLSGNDPSSATVDYGQADGAIVGGARLQLFFKRVVVEDAAPQLRPYLQRAGVLWFEGHGAYESTSDTSSAHQTRAGGGASIGTDAYLTSALAVWLAVGLDRFSQEDQQDPETFRRRFTALDLGGGLAVRAGATRIGLGYRHRGAWINTTLVGGPTADRYQSPGFGAFRLDLRSVFGNQKIDLEAGLSLWDTVAAPGFGADLRATIYLRPVTGLRFGVGGGGGAISPASPTRLVLDDPSSAFGTNTILTFQWQLGVTHFFTQLYGLEVTYLGRLDHKDLVVGHTDTVGTSLLIRALARF